MELTFTLEEINTAAQWLLNRMQGRSVVAFHGEMGAGKTTLIHTLCERLGVKDHVSSPTFSIINEYRSADGLIYHLDLYRLKNEEEAINAGVEDCLYNKHLCLVEWPEKAPDLLPDDTLHVYLDMIGTNTRSIRIK
jgi:tRNA threonylcarbamoyladenosine biosynthesis protein TsaE